MRAHTGAKNIPQAGHATGAQFSVTHDQENGFRMSSGDVKDSSLLARDFKRGQLPAGAQGMNTGIQDAYNLAWKLALVIKGEADETLLDMQRRMIRIRRFDERASKMVKRGQIPGPARSAPEEVDHLPAGGVGQGGQGGVDLINHSITI